MPRLLQQLHSSTLSQVFARIGAAIQLPWRRREVESYVIRACINKLMLDERANAGYRTPQPRLKSVSR